MPKKLMIALDGGNREQRDAITYHLNAKGWQIWHWFADLWLLANVSDEASPQNLWRELDALPPLRGKSILISTVEGPMTFFGAANPQGWPWMTDNWGKADVPGTPTEVPVSTPASPKLVASV